MNELFQIRPFARLCAVALMLGVAACGQPSATGAGAEPPLAGASIGGPFSLIDQDGKAVTDRDFAGKFRLMYFGYSFCPDVCPVDLQKLMAGYRLLEQRAPELAARIQPVFVTVDPARDTPAVLKSYVAAFHPRLIGLTGTEAEIADVTRRYAIVFRRDDAKGTTDYLVDHSRQTYLFGPKGDPIALIPQDGTPEAIADELQRWAK